MSTVSASHESFSHRRSSALLGLRITFSGLLCAAVVGLVGLAALNSEANLLFLLFGISVGVVVFSALAPVFVLRKVDVERIVPMAVVAGRPFTLSYLVRSRRRWVRSWSLVVGEMPAGRRSARFPLGFVENLEPGAERRVELSGVCSVRGRVPLPGVRLLSRFPFGLFACSVDIDSPAELIVYPAAGRFRRDPWRERRSPEAPSSRSARRHSDEHEEFFGVREYRPGDNMRWIHWRRSARVGELIVRESTPARTQQLTVVLDPWPAVPNPDGADPQARERRTVPAGRIARLLGRFGSPWRSRRSGDESPWPEAEVERIISLAATAACEALERGHRVGLLVRAAVPVVIAPSGGRSHRQRLLHEMAMIKPGAAEGLDALVSRIRWSSGWHGRCLLCATRQDRNQRQVIRFLAVRAESAIIITCDSEKFESLFEAAPDALTERPPASERRMVATGRAR